MGRPEGIGPEGAAGEPAGRDVAAATVAGLLAGVATWALAAGLAEMGQAPRAPLRLIASSLLGAQALDASSSLAPWLGAVLGALAAVVLGLVLASVVPEGAGLGVSAAAGAAWGLVAFAAAWLAVAPLAAPLLHAAGRPHLLAVAALHAAFGAAAGALLTVARSALD
jgi:hypothetical protein